MRILALLILLISFNARAQLDADALAITQRIADSGAPQTALARVEQLQPTVVSAPRWDEWEKLRCDLMLRLGRHQALVQRAAALPAGAADAVTAYCQMQAARAAIALSQGAVARETLARLLWRQNVPAAEARALRLLVIESYLAENKPQDAYALMLRYQQDFRPVDRETAARFVDALLSAGMDKEAVNWYSQLDEASPVMVRIRLASGLITPDAAVAQVRAVLAKSRTASAWWSVLKQAATLQNNLLLQVEALENLLHTLDDSRTERISSYAAELWKLYIAAAQEFANKEQLLQGDDANWSDYAARRMGASPVMARVFYAHLARLSKSTDSRQNAQLQLVFSLRGDNMGLVALHLFNDQFPVAQLDAQARYLLGSIALDRDQAAVAARYWLGLSVPPASDPDEWQIRLAQTLVRGGQANAGADALRALLAGRTSLPSGTMQRAVACVQQLQDSAQLKAADDLYRLLLPLADARDRRKILVGLGRVAEAGKSFQHAADFFLQAALLGDGGVADAVAFDARIAAASNMVRAGLKDDARAQLDWLQKNVKESEKLEIIRRERQKL